MIQRPERGSLGLGGSRREAGFGGNLERARGMIYVGTYVERVNRPKMLTGGFLGEVLCSSRNTLDGRVLLKSPGLGPRSRHDVGLSFTDRLSGLSSRNERTQ
jgi:hypothetical protein